MTKIKTIHDLDCIHKLIFYNKDISINENYETIQKILNSLKSNLPLHNRKKKLNDFLLCYLSIVRKYNLDINNIINMEIDFTK